jgi:hypothetical protein
MILLRWLVCVLVLLLVACRGAAPGDTHAAQAASAAQANDAYDVAKMDFSRRLR